MQVEDLCTALGQRLRSARIACRFTQEQLAAKAHVSSRQISKIENGKMNPSYEILHALIRAMNISADTLFFPEQSENDLLFQRLCAYYRACPPVKREVLLHTIEFITDNLLSEKAESDT